jgi:hypothetical protein
VESVRLGFKACDLHELSCHFVAEYAGLYREYGLEVTLEDTRRVADEQLPDSLFSAACGAALIRWLRGASVRVEVVATNRPMFWLHAARDVHALQDVRAGTIATYPAVAPPAQFLRIVLEDAGLKPDVDVKLVPGADDAARIEMLRRGDVVAALFSSAMLPHCLEQLGFDQLLCIGDRLCLPTTGLAVSSAMIERHPDTVNAMADAFRAALRLIHGDDTILREALRGSALVDEQDVGRAGAVVREFFTADGRVSAADVLPGVQRVAAVLGMPPVTEVESLYGSACALPGH